MKNPVSRTVRRRRYKSKRSPMKTQLLKIIANYLGTDQIVHNSTNVRKSLRTIVADDELWKRLAEYSTSIKKLALYGVEQGY